MRCNDSPSSPLLRRKKQQRPIEGTRTRCMRGSSPKASVECTARHHDVLHSSLFFFVCDRAQAAATPSAHVSLGRPQSPCVVYSIHGLVALLLRFSVVVVGAVEPLAAQAFERARLWHLHDVPPTRSSLLDRGEQDVICGPIFSWCFGLQRRGLMPPHGLGIACTWEEQRTSRGRSRSVDRSSSSSAPRGTCVLHALRGAQC